jgi:hypothetical protein
MKKYSISQTSTLTVSKQPMDLWKQFIPRLIVSPTGTFLAAINENKTCTIYHTSNNSQLLQIGS